MFLQHIDLYGTECRLNTFGQTRFKTWFGAFNTTVSLIIFTVIFYLFGKDFFYKTNPKIIYSDKNPSQSESVFVNNSNFTVAWRVEDEDENQLKEEERVIWPVIEYYIYEKNEDKKFDLLFEQRFKPKTCSATSVTENKHFTSQDLSTLDCVDLDEIKEAVNQKLGTDTDLPLWGNWDENYVAYLFVQFSACKFDFEQGEYFDCLSFEETQKRVELDNYVSFYLPRFTFIPESVDSPLNIYYESLYYKVNPFSELYEIYNYSLISLEDDRGWIFEDIHSDKAIERTGLTRNFNFLQKEAYEQKGKAVMFMADFLFTRKQLVLKRSFVKIQEIVANLGGLMQVVYVFFYILSQEYGLFKRNEILVNRYFFSMKEKGPKIKTINTQNFSSFNFTKKLGKVNRNITFFGYFASKRLCCTNRERKHYLEAENVVEKMLDLEELVKIGMKVEYLCENTLNQQGKQSLTKQMTQFVQADLARGARNKRAEGVTSIRDKFIQFRSVSLTEKT